MSSDGLNLKNTTDQGRTGQTMPKVVRIGAKSGVLPKPRQVVPTVKAPFEAAQAAKIKDGFAEAGMAPKSITTTVSVKKNRSVEERIALSAKEPKQPLSAIKESLTDTQRWKEHIAQVRRVYLSNSLKAYESAEASQAAQRERRHQKSLEKKQQMTAASESEATLLTMPTIESSLLAGAMVEPRTEEEAEELSLMRKQNRLLTEKNQEEAQSKNLLQLLHKAKKFILTEEDLNRKVDSLFSQDTLSRKGVIAGHQTEYMIHHAEVVDYRRGAKYAQQRELAAKQQRLVDALTGTIDHRAGLAEVQSVLESETSPKPEEKL